MYQFLDLSLPRLEGEIMLKFIGADFLSRNEMKKWKAKLSEAQNKACTQKEHYFVTL